MIITIDIGNTMTDIAFVEGEKCLAVYKTKSDPDRSHIEYLSLLSSFLKSKEITLDNLEGAIISSVVPALGNAWERICEESFGIKPFIIGPRLKTGLMIKTDNPKEVGADLIAVTCGAKTRWHDSCVIVDMGTATKVMILDKNGCFAGVAIAPGYKISIDALVDKTAALPEVSLKTPMHVIGKNTEDCMNSGMNYGTAYMVKGFADAFEKEVGYPLKRILTGGNARYVKDILPEFIYDEGLIFEGLLNIYNRNKK
ncbi:MAG: type III pantothenate kinase [Bacilli bacterium]|nr:type III pantothenate kinase [Bacilli bacterium]